MQRPHSAQTRRIAARTRNALVAVAVALLVTLTGCASQNTRPQPYQPQPVAEQVWRPQAQVAPADSIPAPSSEQLADAGHRSVDLGTAKFIDQDAARLATPGETKDGDVTFNFEGDSLNAVVKAILGDYLQQNYVIAPGVQGTVTFSTAKPMRRDQVMSILEMLLRWNNATLVWDDGRYTILPVDQALPGNLIPGVGKPSRLGYQVRAVPLSYISATEMEKLLKPYARPNSVISTDNARSMIVLAGTPAELNNYLQTIQIFDVDWLEGMSVGIFPMQQIEASKVVGELEKVFGVSSDTPMAGLFRFMPLEGINAVLVITPQPKYLRTAEEWLQRLDQGSSGGGQRLYVYEVKNVKASDLADTLSDVFGSGGGSSRSSSGDNAVGPGLQPVSVRSSRLGGGSRNTNSRSNSRSNVQAKSADVDDGAEGFAKSGGLRIQEITPTVDTPTEQGGTPAAAEPRQASRQASRVDRSGSGQSDSSSTGIVIGETEEVRISAVEESNSLLVKASPAQWESIHGVIERLDKIPLQVQIEAQIVQVDLNKSLEYGVRWFFENAVPEDLATIPDPDDEEETATATRNLLKSALGRTIWGDLSGTINAGSGLTWTFLGRNAGAIITALDAVSRVSVLSAPSVVVLNNKSANINVGSQVPVSTTNINPANGGGVGAYQSFQYLQTGITLDVTPRVNPGGLVFLEIQQDDSTPGDVPKSGGNPPISQRTISTEVAVQSGETVLLGGLIKQTDLKGKSGVPFFSRIPVVGGLFGRDTSSSQRQELIVLIKPTVIYNQEDARRVTEEYRSRFQGLEPLRVKVEGESQ